MYKLIKTRKKFKFKESFDFLSYPITINNIEISIVNEKIIKVLVKENINETFNKLVSNILKFIEDDESETDDELLLTQLYSLNNVIFNLYKDYFSKAELNKYARNIRLLVNELKIRSKNKVTKKEVTSSRRSR